MDALLIGAASVLAFTAGALVVGSARKRQRRAHVIVTARPVGSHMSRYTVQVYDEEQALWILRRVDHAAEVWEVVRDCSPCTFEYQEAA